MALKLNKKNKAVKKVVKKELPKVKKVSRPLTDAAITLPTGSFVEGIGRRKVASARVRLYDSVGDFIVNDKIVGQYFQTIPDAHVRYNRPFELTGTKNKFSISVKISGSGAVAQLEAMIHGIARALVNYDPSFKALLKPEGYLTRDDRMKETRKIGMGGKARRKRQSPKR